MEQNAVKELFNNFNGYLIRFYIQQEFTIIFQKHSFNSLKNHFQCINETIIDCKQALKNDKIHSLVKSEVESSKIDLWILVKTEFESFWQLISIFSDNLNYSKGFYIHDKCSKLKIKNENCLFAILTNNQLYSVFLSSMNDELFFEFFDEDKKDELIINIPNYFKNIQNYEIIFTHSFQTGLTNFNLFIIKLSSQHKDSLLALLCWFENGKFLIENVIIENLLGEFCNFDYKIHSPNQFFRLKSIFCFELFLKINKMLRVDGKCLINTFSSHQIKSRIIYCSNGCILNEIITNQDYVLVRPITLTYFDLSTDETIIDEMFFVAKCKNFSFQFFKESPNGELLKAVYELTRANEILIDEFISDCKCCLSNQLLIIKNWNENDFLIEHQIKTSLTNILNSVSLTQNSKIIENFKSEIKSPVYEQIKKLLECKINEAWLIFQKILKETKHKNYLINTLLNLHYNQFMIQSEFLYLTKIYSRYESSENHLKVDSGLLNLVKKWSCFLQGKFLLNLIVKIDEKY